MNFMSLLNLKTKTEPKYFNKAAEEIKEEKFIEDIFNIGDEKTIIFISHKMSALSKCDKIFDLKQKRFIK